MSRIAKLLKPSDKESLFKIKLYFLDDGQRTYYSYDFDFEREEFKNRPPEQFISDRDNIGPQFFARYNGFRKQYEFATKLKRDGKLKKAMIYANKVYEQYPTGFMPMIVADLTPKN